MTKSQGTTTAAADAGWRPDLRSPLVLGLLLVLALQLVAALGLSLSGPGMKALAPQTPLVEVKPEQIERITIEGPGDEEQVQLVRQSKDAWVIAELGDLPVTTTKVDQLLNAVTSLKRPLPVGTSEEARKRFKVADGDFVRRLTLEGSDGQKATLLFGETPGFRRLYGRPADDSQVYDLPLALSDVSNRRDDWTQTGLLKLDEDKITGISGKDWSLSKTDDGWQLEDSSDPLDEGAASELANKLATLSYRGVLGIKDDATYNQQKPVLELHIALKDGGEHDYRLSQAKDSDDYVLKDSGQPYYFKLSKYDLEGLLDLDRTKLIVQPEPAETATPAETAPSNEPAEPAPAAESVLNAGEPIAPEPKPSADEAKAAPPIAQPPPDGAIVDDQ